MVLYALIVLILALSKGLGAIIAVPLVMVTLPIHLIIYTKYARRPNASTKLKRLSLVLYITALFFMAGADFNTTLVFGVILSDNDLFRHITQLVSSLAAIGTIVTWNKMIKRTE